MPIYTRNSVGSFADTVVANENYSFSDMGRILVENAQNDMAVFNAVMANDFRESAAIREGTMIGSELQTFREFSAKEAWEGLKAKLHKLWEKIKGVFRQVYAKLGVWFVRNGKAFVAMNRKILANKTGLGDCKIPLYLKAGSGKKAIEKPVASIRNKAAKMLADAEKGATFKKGDASEVSAIADELCAGAIPGATASTMAESYKKYCFTEVKDSNFSSLGVSVEDLFNTIIGKGDAIKDLKKAEKEIDKSIKDMIRTLDSKANEANDKKANSGAKYSNASKICSGFEKAITVGTRAAISCVKAEVANARQVVGKLVAYSPKGESAVLEMTAWLEGADDFATSEDIPAEEITADDVQGDPDVVVNVDIAADGDECGEC